MRASLGYTDIVHTQATIRRYTSKESQTIDLGWLRIRTFRYSHGREEQNDFSTLHLILGLL